MSQLSGFGLGALGALPALPGLAPPLQPAPPRDPALQPLDPQEEETLLERIGKGALGGLAYLGGTLSKALGGRAIRGLLGGRPEELLSVIPTSDFLNITDPSKEVHGSEILGKKDAPFLSPEGLGGFGLEVLTDPATYLTFGSSALTKAGRIARSAGVLPDTVGARATTTLGDAIRSADTAIGKMPIIGETPVAGRALAAGAPDVVPYAQKAAIAAEKAGMPLEDLLGQKLGGVAGFRFPFMEPTGIMGAGPGGKAFMDLMGRFGSFMGNRPGIKQVGQTLAPVGRSLKAMFQPEMMGATGEAAQKVAPDVYQGIREGAEAVRGREARLVTTALKESLDSPEQAQLLRQILEGQVPNPGGPIGEMANELMGVINDSYADYLHWGGTPKELKDVVAEYFPRRMRFEETARGRSGAKAFRTLETKYQALGPREEILKDIPGATGTAAELDPAGQMLQKGTGLEGIRTDPRIMQSNPLQAADIVRRDYLAMTPQNFQRMADLNKIKGTLEDITKQYPRTSQQWLDADTALAELAGLQGKFDQGTKLADMYQKTVPREGMLGFTYHPIDDAAFHVMAEMKQTQAQKGIFGLIKNSAVDAAEAGPGAVKIEKLLDDMGIKGGTRLDRLAELGIDANAYMGGKLIPADAYADAVRYFNGFTRPEAISPVLDAIDYATRLFKGWVTSLWPSYHMRNFVSNTWMNSLEGALSKRSIGMAHTLLGGETVEGASKLTIFKGMKLTDEEATDAIRRLAYQYRVAGEHTAVSAGELADTSAELLRRLPGKEPNTLKEMWQAGTFRGERPQLAPGAPPPTWWESQANPLNPQTFGPNIAGRKLGTRIEETSRLSGFIELLDQGMAPEIAGARIRAAQVDYGNLTQFEKTVMRRLIPFYTYSRIAIPYQIEQMMQRPGGLLGTAVKAAGEMRGAEPGFLPDYLKNTVAMPIGEATDQQGVPTQRFLSQLGLPFEDLTQNLSMRGLLGGINPYIKAPLELATNQQFFSGRKLSDLYSPTGNPITDQIIYNSPVARVASTISNVADPRKGLADMLLHTFSGVRLSDVDMAKARNVAVRDFLDQAMTGPQFRHFQSTYVRPEDLGTLSPAQQELYRLYITRERAAQQLARQQR
jgi:hypothetical protein